MDEQPLKQLKSNQEDSINLNNKLSKKKEEFNELNKVLIYKIESLSEKEFEIKEVIRNQAESEYAETKQKKLLGGIGIRILSKLEYEESDAMDWAKEKMPVAIKTILDKKQFETFAKTNDLDFVNKTEKVSVTFPKEIII